MNELQAPAASADRVRRLELRLDRERRARLEAERLLETKSHELYEANRALAALASDLEQRVEERTRELSTERERALKLAELDVLTGIANRASFSRELGATLKDPAAMCRGIAVLLIDLDDFKTINDTLGHAAGDSLLVEIAERLRRTVRPGDTVARLGGDEFAVIAHGCSERQGALLIADRLLRALCRPSQINGRSVLCSCSIGMAQSTIVGGDADELLRDADLALYASKGAGRARVTGFEASLRVDLERRAALEAEVRQAVADDRIEPWYQPIIGSADGCVVGAEVLARWHVPGGDVRPPAAFLEAVESLGLLDAMMENMLVRALQEASAPIASGALEYLSINVSPSQFNQGWALSRLPSLLAEARFPAHALVVEITETALLHNIERTRDMVRALCGSGIRIALDDFGVGYSNFSLLRQLPFDLLKLDRSLTCDIDGDTDARALAECIVDLASRLRIKVVAEGVETSRQADLLRAAGCGGMQGYWFARPQRNLLALLG